MKFTAMTILVFMLTLALPKELFAHPLLQKEAEGTQVVELQQKLIDLEYLHTNATGYYGSLTEEAVRQLQQDFKLAVDGIAGPQTFNRLTEIEKLARIVHGEARGEPYKGQVAVAAVVKNRVNSSEFPSTVEGVIYQRNAFTAVHDGQYDLTPTSTSYKAVRDAWTGWDPSDGATYYYNPDIATSAWIFTRTPKFSIGRHLFAE
ncbi:cell wall hydrolase [Halalkalibacterium halodurans]|uniref:cell wall hydrolase n=1 Tax=Halalkalibacterium halodurans TaxID=86665 RepID=UPI002E225F22|nr:cell wall hydrolase [Halalkalibacterium halodurans]MED4163156.1 cell wall hydrolase [Halalkalibacterium halodurans]